MNYMYRFVGRPLSLSILITMTLPGWIDYSHAQSSGIDPQAEKILRRMSDYLAGRQQLTLKTESTLERY